MCIQTYFILNPLRPGWAIKPWWVHSICLCPWLHVVPDPKIDLSPTALPPQSCAKLFWPSRFPLSRWSPSESNFRNAIMVHPEYMAKPPDTSVLYLFHSTLVTCPFIEIHVWNFYLAGKCSRSYGGIYIMESLNSPHTRMDDSPAYLSIQ